jgi:(S)-mandelate dehydrogenase
VLLNLSRARSIADLRAQAKARLPRSVFDFFDGGAEDEITLRDNAGAFDRIRLAPKALIGVAHVDTRTDIVGAPAELPIAIAPTGAPGLGWPNGDVEIARAAARFGIPYSLATSATASIERVAAEAGGRLWFQSYVFKRREYTEQLIARALAAGYDALMITVDLPVGGKRERDLRNDFAIPFRFTRRNFLDFALHPTWSLGTLWRGVPRLENLAALGAELETAAAAASFVGRNYDPSFDWDDLGRIRDRWPKKLIVKGIVRPDDAERLVAIGCDAIVVSNHGGRQLDGAVAALDALPGVAAAVGNRIAVLVDGGVRRGSHVFRALALGAQAVLVGRAVLYGVAAGGHAGVVRALEILREELVRTMQLAGARSIAGIGPDLLFRPRPPGQPPGA